MVDSRCAYPTTENNERRKGEIWRKRNKKNYTKGKDRIEEREEEGERRERITAQKFKILALEDVTARIIATYRRYRRYTFIIENEMGEKIV